MAPRVDTVSAAPLTDSSGFRVTYFDSHCGSIRWEDFDDEPAAARFARSWIRNEDEWAIVDPLPVPMRRRTAA
jgi:hypothetical protein